MLRPAIYCCDPELGVLSHTMPGDPDKDELDHYLALALQKLHPDGFVDDPAITRIEHHRLANILRRCRNIEQQSDLSRIGLLGEVQAEGAVVDRFSRIFQKLALSTRGNAPLSGVELAR
jgi:hypothetical protein